MTNELAPLHTTQIAELAAVYGDLSKLSSEQRMEYYGAVCRSVGLNPLTRPFEYIQLNGKLTLYARKDATDQLRAIRSISIDKPEISYEDDWIIVTVVARDANGRTDSDIGVVSRKDMRGDFGNVLMKAITKAKRRATLSICGLGMLDETEIETIPNARPIVAEPVKQITTCAPEGLPEIDRLKRDVKLLRDCERAIGLPPTEFVWKSKSGVQPLRDELQASRARLEEYAPGLAEMARRTIEETDYEANPEAHKQVQRYHNLVMDGAIEMMNDTDLVEMLTWLYVRTEVEEGELVTEPAL